MALILLLPAVHAFALSTPGIPLRRPPPRAVILAADSPPPPPPPSPPVFSGRDGGDDENENSINPSLLFAAALSQIRRMPFLLPAALFALYRPFRRAVRTQMSIMPIILRLKLFEKQRFSSAEERLAARDTLDEVLAPSGTREEAKRWYGKGALKALGTPRRKSALTAFSDDWKRSDARSLYWPSAHV